ncbi:MAG: 50S ribosomal protein L11 methyltransferase [Bdellovibrionales bacterium]
MKSYFVVHLERVTLAAEEWLSENAFAFGALGTSEVLDFDQPHGEEEVFTRVPKHRAVDVYFQSSPDGKFFESLRSRFPDVQVRVQSETEKDWLAEWKTGFKPFALVHDHWVVPSWCEPPELAKHKIWIDPGMAFGTGTHETTRLVAQALARVCSQERVGSLLDVGTGTGILAVLAHQLGVPRIVATDVDADARRVARENFSRNGCVHVCLDGRQFEDLSETFDVVIANIIDGVLVRIQRELLARVRPGGWLLVSGIIAERERDFLSGFSLPAPGSVLPSGPAPPDRSWTWREQEGDWVLYGAKV